MHFPKLETYQAKHVALRESIRALDGYLYELFESSPKGDISPPLVAKRLRIEEAIALVLLMFAHKSGIITPRYFVYCPNNEDFIASYSSSKELPKTIDCPYDEKQHDSNEYFTELTFQFSADLLSQSTNSSA